MARWKRSTFVPGDDNERRVHDSFLIPQSGYTGVSFLVFAGSGIIDPFTDVRDYTDGYSYLNASGIIGPIEQNDILLSPGTLVEGSDGEVTVGSMKIVFPYASLSGALAQGFELSLLHINIPSLSGAFTIQAKNVDYSGSRPIFVEMAIKLTKWD